ncbi:hypothetical protein VPJ68_04550, partial [Parabacteroides distasonis]
LKNHKGEYAEAYAARAPWVHRFDLRITEDFSFKAGKTEHNDMIKGYEWGTDCSPEGLQQGLTHCFFLTFHSDADRLLRNADEIAYLPERMNKRFEKKRETLLRNIPDTQVR